MIFTIPLPVSPEALDLKGRSVEQAVEEANERISSEVSKSNPFVGPVMIGRLDSGRWFFRHTLMGVMIRVPDELREIAFAQLRNSIVMCFDLVPPEGFPRIAGVHGLWAKDDFVLALEGEARQTGIVIGERVVEGEAAHV